MAVNQLSREAQGYQQVLHYLQRLRRQVLQQGYSLNELDNELDALRSSIEQNGYTDRAEVEQISTLLCNFRSAILFEVSH